MAHSKQSDLSPSGMGASQSQSTPAFRIFGWVTAAAASAVLWGLLAKGISAALGFHPSNVSIFWAVFPIAIFLALVLAPIMLRRRATDEDQVDNDSIADQTVTALTSVHSKLEPVTPQRRASSA